MAAMGLLAAGAGPDAVLRAAGQAHGRIEGKVQLVMPPATAPPAGVYPSRRVSRPTPRAPEISTVVVFLKDVHGSYRYTYESGHSGESCVVAFAIRGRELVVYVLPDAPGQAALLARLGKHTIGKSCLYFKRLADLDVDVLEKIIAGSHAEVRRRHP
jgi:hypothetical protein